MADHYDDYSREQLMRLLRECDRRRHCRLVWERDEIDHELSVKLGKPGTLRPWSSVCPQRPPARWVSG